MDKLYIIGPTTHEEMWLERRRWWQFWLPRYVEKYRAWETWPSAPPRPSSPNRG